MANCCFYDMMIVGKFDDVIRMYKIMKYEDPTFFIYRVRDICVDDMNRFSRGLYAMRLSGEVAWSSYDWVDTTMRIVKDRDTGKNQLFTDLVFLSELLDLGIEWFTEENGMDFCEHYAVRKGKMICQQSGSYSNPWYSIEQDGSIEDILKDIKEGYESELDPEDLPLLLDDVKSKLEEDGEVSFSIGGYVSEFDPDNIWNGNVNEIKQTPYTIED